MVAADVRLNQPVCLRLGPLRIEPAKRRLLHDDGRELFLEPKVIQVLAALIRADGEILSRDDLVDRVWGGRAIGDEAVFRAVSRLRQTTEGIAAGVFRIETIPKAGYRLVAESPAPPPLERVVPTPAAPVSRRGLVLAAGAAAVAGPAILAIARRPGMAAKRERLAVLPFAAGEGTAASLVDGFVTELPDKAGRLAGMDTVGAASSFRSPMEKRHPAGVAGFLGATLVLRGEVSVSAGEMTVSTELRGAPDGDILWSDMRRGPTSDLFRLRDGLLARIAASAGVAGPPSAGRPVDPEALLLYLTARARRSIGRAEMASGIEALLDCAVARDPGFAEAWAALGGVRLRNAYRQWITAPRGTVFDRDRLTAAIAAAHRASDLQPTLTEPYLTIASAMGYLGAWSEAHRATQEALKRNGVAAATLLKLGQRRAAVAQSR